MSHRRRRALVLAVVMCVCVVVPVGGQAGAPGGAQAECYMYDNAGVPRTARAFLAGIVLEEGQTAQLCRNGDDVDPDDSAATGDTLSIYDSESVLVGEQVLVVVGDVTGTGSAGMCQLVRMASALYHNEPLEGPYALAADISGSGQLDLADLVEAAEQYKVLRDGVQHDIAAAQVTSYRFDLANPEPMSVYFLDGEKDIPYVALDDVRDILVGAICKAGETDQDEIFFATEVDGSIIRWIRDNGSVAEMDFANGTIAFSSFNRFTCQPYVSTGLDVVCYSGLNDEGELQYFTRPPGSFERSGLPVLFDLAAHGIEMVQDKDGQGYLPLQTFGDVFLAPTFVQSLYNGEAVFFVGWDDTGALSDLYYSAPTGERSAALAEFSYNELCLALDMYYGLKEQHNIQTFETLFEQTGLDKQLRSTDPVVADKALATLGMGYLSDMHSGLVSPSYLAGREADVFPDFLSPFVQRTGEDMFMFMDARDAVYPDGVPGYEEVGNTAYVTFDVFSLPDEVTDHYETPPDASVSDTIGLVMYAHSRIMREDSPVENVVLDLSCNRGGMAEAGLFVIGWFLGGRASISINDTLTHAQATTVYGVDVNADGVVDETDSVASKNLYCLISPVSFSCANVVPSAFKDSGQVTLLGRASGGGACIVRPLSMADGSLLQISGPLRVASLSNGAYGDIEEGIAPDVPIVNVDDFYDREGLTEFVNGLFR